MSTYRKCFLKSIEHTNLSILLEDQTELILGRSPKTNIIDKRCSKNQVSLLANYNTNAVTVRHVGRNPCSANGIILRNESLELKHNDILAFLVGKYHFRIEFDPSAEKRKNITSLHLKQSNENALIIGKKMCTEENKSRHLLKCEQNKWEKIDDGKLYIFTSVGVLSSPKIAAYDLDGTIILTKSGRVFPKDGDDWKLANLSVKTKISKQAADGYKIVILTNQAGIGRGKTNLKEFKTKIENVIAALGVPVQAFIASSTSIYRKPAPGMWNFLESHKNDGLKIDMVQSFYVGDAAGRIANWAPGRKKDFSLADRLLALNLKLHFFTPEEHFLNEHPGKFTLPLFNPANLDGSAQLADGEIISRTQEVVVMVGYPGSGKSHFVRTHLVPAGYTHVNRDVLGSWQKCLLAMEAALAAGRCVVIDNTNPDRESRQRFIVKTNVPCRCFVMSTTIDHVRHNNRFREFTDSKHIPVNDMIINSYKNKFEAPSLQEGFTQIVKINLIPSFSDPELKKLYEMYLMEK